MIDRRCELTALRDRVERAEAHVRDLVGQVETWAFDLEWSMACAQVAGEMRDWLAANPRWYIRRMRK